ncbi:MAG: alpha-glucan family phosphorylase [Pseudomonadota bacterium]
MDVRKFFIRPFIPEKINKLLELAFNVWATWDKDAEKLFHRLDPQLFRSVAHNPVELLYRLTPERLEEVAKDKGFQHELKQVYEKFKTYMEFEGTYKSGKSEKTFSKEDTAVYMCMEYGLHESIPLYSGGLAVLAGDQLKAASDVGFPLIAFGLLYKFGYFNQRISADGSQMEDFKETAWYLRAIKEVIDEHGNPRIIEIPLKGRKVFAKIWAIQVGRVPLYLLDTNIPQNPPEIRKITNMLYDSGRSMRLEQEIVLGRGGIIAMKALGIEPKIYHLNEGHTAFSILERLLDLTKNKGYKMEEARSIIRFSTVFTTHTPVVEGNEHFDDELIEEYFEEEVKELGLTMDEFLALGKIAKEKIFWLPAFALRYSRCSNGVSKIHSGVARNMWRELFSTLHERDIPIDSITNGVHLQSWLSLQMTELFDRYIGPDYLHKAEDKKVWEKVKSIPDSEIWNSHRRRKEQVASFVRRRVTTMMKGRGYCGDKIKDVEQVLNPDYLTIGFARRFASYKRADLILSDPERLAAILTNKEKPVQIIFAGKAHPADGNGKEIIKKIVNFINTYPVENHVVFIEDYDMNISRHLVQGVDLWLNTPVKPMEASGTSGIKAGINGVLNFSVLDGWWPEAYNGENGWAIAIDTNGHGEIALSNKAEANLLYELLENEITQAYYDRTENDIPMKWVSMMKNSIATVSSEFNMHRTVRDYFNKFYLPQAQAYQSMMENHAAPLKNAIKQKKHIDAVWPQIYIKDYFTNIHGKMPVSGQEVDIDCYVYLDNIDENLIEILAFYCSDENTEICKKIPLKFVEKYQDKVAKFYGKLELEGIGQQQLSVCMVPSDENFRTIYPEYAKWKE